MQNVEATRIHLAKIKHDRIGHQKVNELLITETNGIVQCCVVIRILQ